MSYVYISVVTGNIISFTAGSIIAWSSPEIEKLRNPTYSPFETPISKAEGSWISAFLPCGAIFGPFIYGYLNDKIGRKKTLLAIGFPLIFCFLLMTGKHVAMFYAARFISGLTVGGLFTVLPNYVGEIADSHNRGALTSIMNIFLCAGMLFSYGVGPYVTIATFNILLAIFPLLFVVLFFLIGSESAYYYLKKEEYDSAKEALQKVRGADVDIEEELKTITKKIKEAGHGTFLDIFKSKVLTKAFIISVGLVIFQQFTGINAVLFFSQSIFAQAGVDLEPAVCSIIIGVVQFATSFATPLVVDRLGRKVLLQVSAIGMVLAEAPLGAYCYLKFHDYDVSAITFLPIACLILFIISYNFGFGPLAWSVMGELFPSNVKSVASSATAAICWCIGFFIAKYFESVSDMIGMGSTFWIFSLCCGCAVPFIHFIVLETKGKSLHEIQEALEK